MSQTYTIETLGGPNRWDNEPNKGDYFATFQGDEREVLIFHDSSGDFDPPKIGDEVFGDIEKDKRGQWRLKRKPRQKSGGSGKGGGYSPEDIARITRSHAQEMAVRFVAATGDAAELPIGTDPGSTGAYLNGPLRKLVDWFNADVLRAAEQVKQAQASPQVNGGGGEVPADTVGMAPAAATMADDAIPFRSRSIPDREARGRDLFLIG